MCMLPYLCPRNWVWPGVAIGLLQTRQLYSFWPGFPGSLPAAAAFLLHSVVLDTKVGMGGSLIPGMGGGTTAKGAVMVPCRTWA